MNRIFNIGLLLLFLVQVGVSAQRDLSRHHQTKFDEYLASSIEKLSISNRHGMIHYTGWDKDTLAIRVSIWVEAPNSEMATEVHEQINISQQPVGDSLDYRTSFEENFFSNFAFGIDYHIFGPRHLALELRNLLGDITLEEYNGSASLTAEYGNLTITKNAVAMPKAIIQVTNGDLTIGDLQKAEITHKNGQLQIKHVGELSLISDFSTATINRVEKMNLRATTGKMNIGQAGSVNLTTKRTDIVISELRQHGFIESQRGRIQIQSVHRSLQELTLAGDLTPIELQLADDLPFNLHGQVTNGQFIYPEKKKIRTLKENNTLSFSGAYNSKNKTVPNFIIFNKNSDIQLITK
ncbi:hypothetical protein [Geofilum rubicundum]|uniref:Adhesin domain-containing protein n=1 Tax=Geofilum rubicundum JCM 15548 TaxID=1236989 RepID=A0A0E9LZE8_9BACT|nr:hypothetical protein [Geofilum rubicundum]GAO30496.1 hypothetical protein JCM15548_12771 [Geofilum rubicundum JCM 15548]